jgi:DNA polymerase phi
MFRIDPYIARIFKERNLPGSETKQSQLMLFKFRVLMLLEIYLQKNPGIPYSPSSLFFKKSLYVVYIR